MTSLRQLLEEAKVDEAWEVVWGEEFNEFGEVANRYPRGITPFPEMLSQDTELGLERARLICEAINQLPNLLRHEFLYLQGRRTELEHCREVAYSVAGDVLSAAQGGVDLKPVLQGVTRKAIHIATVLDGIIRGWQ